jgi:hypothetical protein
MWLGHIFMSILFWVFARRTLNLPLLLIGGMVPNIDFIFCHFKITDKNFHMGFIHTPFFLLLASIPLYFLNFNYWLAFLSGSFTHLIGDVGCDTGIMFLYPISKKRFTLNMWNNTGINAEIYMYKGIINDITSYYSQRIPKIIELLMVSIISFFLLFTNLFTYLILGFHF